MRASAPVRVWRRGTAAAWLLIAGLLVAVPSMMLAPGSQLELVVQPHGRGEPALRRTVTLYCGPVGGGHPHAVAACQALDEAGGDLDALPGSRGMSCLPIYSPATATARGTWEGRRVAWRQIFDNLCQLGAETGAVFRF